MSALRVVIVDDEPLARRGLELELRKIPDVTLVGAAGDGEAGLDLIRSARPDVVLLDVKMPILDGLQLAGMIGDECAPAIIFVTAFGQFALDAFNLAAIDYVLKPIAPKRLQAAIERARTRVEQTTAAERAAGLQSLVEAMRMDAAGATEAPGAAIWVTGPRGRQRLALSEIEWFEAQRDYVRIHAGARSCIQRGTLSDLSGKLDAVFVRVHRSAIVNLNAVSAIERRGAGLFAVRLKSDAEIPIGRSFLPGLRARVEQAGIVQIRGRGLAAAATEA